jgi:hypothetical protein
MRGRVAGIESPSCRTSLKSAARKLTVAPRMWSAPGVSFPTPTNPIAEEQTLKGARSRELSLPLTPKLRLDCGLPSGSTSGAFVLSFIDLTLENSY